MANMSSTRKGKYIFCNDCKYQLPKYNELKPISETNKKFPCKKSHRDVRKSGGVKYERDFTFCGLKELK